MADEQITSSTANIPYVNFIDVGADQAAPSAGRAILYIKGGVVYVRVPDGTVTPVGGAVALAEGQLAIGDVGGELAALALGTEGDVVTADAAGKASWAAPAASAVFVGARLTHSAPQACTANTSNILTFDTETFDSDGFHEAVTNPSRLTVPSGKAGYYLIGARFGTSSATSGRVICSVLLNGATTICETEAGAVSSYREYGCETLYHLDVGEYLQFVIYPSATGVTTFGSPPYTPQFWLVKVG